MKNGIGKIILGLAVAFVPYIGPLGLVLIIWGMVNLLSKSGTSLSPQTQKFSEGYKYFHAFDGTAIAVDPDKREVKLHSTFPNQVRMEKVYPISSIRRVSNNLQTGGHMIGFGLVAGSTAMGHNRKVNKDNKLASGLFLDVKDIEFPKWRIAFSMQDQTEQERWYEIMQQAIDGELS